MQGGIPSSHDSNSGFITGPSTGEIPHAGQEGEIIKGWNTCPGGCGCKCRAVTILPDGGEV